MMMQVLESLKFFATTTGVGVIIIGLTAAAITHFVQDNNEDKNE